MVFVRWKTHKNAVRDLTNIRAFAALSSACISCRPSVGHDCPKNDPIGFPAQMNGKAYLSNTALHEGRHLHLGFDHKRTLHFGDGLGEYSALMLRVGLSHQPRGGWSS